MKLIVTGTGTGVGKTFITSQLAEELSRHGTVAAVKPFETGVVDDDPLDHAALRSHSTVPNSIHSEYRVSPPLAPLAATIEGHGPPASLEQVQSELEAMDADHVLVEGAGGLLVPIWERHTFADLAIALKWPALLVTYDGLGTLSHTIACVEAAAHRSIPIAAIVMNRVSPVTRDPSQRTNSAVLGRFVDSPIFVVDHRGTIAPLVAHLLAAS